ncbi:MAG: class A beta-lactamase, partial [Caulobacteraceae bacterium]
LARIEAKVGGRLGLAALDARSGRRLTHRADERFAMCSSFKAMLVAAALARVDRGQERLDRFVRFGEADLLDYAPVARAHVKAGGMTFGELCAAAIELSDNTAANLILASIGGPPGWTRFVRSLGDGVSRLDQSEPALNDVPPGDIQNTTTPAAMLGDLRRVVLGDVLSPGSRAHLAGWMVACKTGLKRLRAGLPADWRVGDKTGTWTGAHNASGDIAAAWTPRGPIVITCYLSNAAAPIPARDAAFAQAARVVARTFRPEA